MSVNVDSEGDKALKKVVVNPTPLPEPQPSYDVGRELSSLASLWPSYRVQHAINHRYTAFEQEASDISKHFNVMVSDVWQRIQAFELLDKESHKLQTTQALTSLEKRFRSNEKLRRDRLYAQYRDQADKAIKQVIRLKQELLFPKFPNTIHGVWFDRGSIVEAGSPANLKKRLTALKEAGMTDIFLKRLTRGIRFILIVRTNLSKTLWSKAGIP